MEDPDSEWEIQEYYSSTKTGDSGSSSMVKWMLNKGFMMGKKLVITGIAISSAPLVVPPLVVFSAMGVAFSIPAGLVFASYAFTNKLMSTLLPIPSPPPLMLEYYYTPDKDEAIELDDYDQIHIVETEDGYSQQYVEAFITNEDDNIDEKAQINDNYKEGEALIIKVDKINVDEDSYTNENVLENDEKECHSVQIENMIEGEEREKMEDIKQGVEIGCGLDAACHVHKQSEQISSVIDFGVGVDDKGYEEDVGEYLEGDDDSLEEPLTDVSRNNIQDVFEDEKEEIVKGSTGLLEKIRDEGRVDNVVEDDYLLSEKTSNLDEDEVKDFETKGPVTVKEISSQKLVDESKNDEAIGEMRHVVILSGGNVENNFNSKELEEIDLVASEVMGDTNREVRKDESDEKVMRESMGTEEKTGGNVSNSRELEELDLVTIEVMGDANSEVSKIESDDKVMGESMITREKTSGNVSNDGSEEVILRTKKEHLILFDSDAKEIADESGMDLVDKRDTNIDLKNLEAGDEAKEDDAGVDVDVLEVLPTFEEASLATDDTKAASKTKTNKKMSSREDILDDEKIWEKIGAMRTIVGYNATRQETCIGELKALYVFTGVEPPGSFKDDTDLDEVKAKLKFLMAIVGVK